MQLAEEEEEREKKQKGDHEEKSCFDYCMKEDDNRTVYNVNMMHNTLDKNLAAVVETAYVLNEKAPSPTNKRGTRNQFIL